MRELLCEPNQLVLQDSAPSLAHIMMAHDQGQPIDATLINDLPYNEFENNPFHEKGLDLADLPRIAREVGEGLKQVEDQIQHEKMAKRRAAGPGQEQPPEQVPTAE